MKVLGSQALTGSVLIPPRHSTESEKDVGFGSCKLNSSVSQQSRPSPHRLRLINRCKSSNFCLIRDQPLSHLKELSQRFQGLILGRSQNFRVIFPKMNCSLKSDPIPLCSHRGLSFDPSDCDHICLTIEKTFSMCST